MNNAKIIVLIAVSGSGIPYRIRVWIPLHSLKFFGFRALVVLSFVHAFMRWFEEFLNYSGKRLTF